MPYIKQDLRKKYDRVLDQMPEIGNRGELEYCIFKLMKQYRNGRDETYTNLHDCAYAATHCGDEFRRRYLDAREDVARDGNGDVSAL